MKKTYYQAQSSKDGNRWTAFNAHHEYDVVTEYDQIKAIYKEMIEFHNSVWTEYKYHRIVKYEVTETIVEVEE